MPAPLAIPIAAMAGGAAMGIGSSFFGKGKKVKLREMPRVDLDAEQRKALAGNIRSLPQAQELAEQVNLFNQGQLDKMLSQALPGLSEFKSRSSDLILSQLRGEIPEDVIQQLRRQGAATGLASGTAGSQFNRNLQLRDIGLTSLQMTQQGLNSAERWITMARQQLTAPMFDMTSMFMTPMERASFELQQNIAATNQANAVATARAQPSPRSAALSNMLGSMGGQLFGVGSMGMLMGGFGGNTGAGTNTQTQVQIPVVTNQIPSSPFQRSSWGMSYNMY